MTAALSPLRCALAGDAAESGPDAGLLASLHHRLSMLRQHSDQHPASARTKPPTN